MDLKQDSECRGDSGGQSMWFVGSIHYKWLSRDQVESDRKYPRTQRLYLLVPANDRNRRLCMNQALGGSRSPALASSRRQSSRLHSSDRWGDSWPKILFIYIYIYWNFPKIQLKNIKFGLVVVVTITTLRNKDGQKVEFPWELKCR